MPQVNTSSNLNRLIKSMLRQQHNHNISHVTLNNWRRLSEENLKAYLFSSICSARTRRQVITEFRESGVLKQLVDGNNLSLNELSQILKKCGIRFPNQKAERLQANKNTEIRKILLELQSFGGNDLQHERWARLILRNELVGMGFKEISDFLKWIGFSRYLAVLDSVNLNFLKEVGMISDSFKLGMLGDNKKYYELEDLENQIASGLRITVSELDNLIVFGHHSL